MQKEVCRRAFHFVVEMRHGERRSDLLDFPRSFSLSCMRVKFKLLIAAIRNAQELLRAALQFIVQKDGLGDFFHGLAHLLALPLHRSIGFFLANLHLGEGRTEPT